MLTARCELKAKSAAGAVAHRIAAINCFWLQNYFVSRLDVAVVRQAWNDPSVSRMSAVSSWKLNINKALHYLWALSLIKSDNARVAVLSDFKKKKKPVSGLRSK